MAPPNTGAISTKGANAMSFADQPVGVKAMVLVLLVSILAGGYYFAFHMSLAEDIERAQREHGTLVTQRAEAVQRQQEFVRISQELAEREPLDRQNRRILPENAEMAAFLGDINRIAELAGLGIDLVEPQPESPDEFYVRIPVKLKLHGRFHQFARFFYSVSQLERAVSMENLNVTVDAAAAAAAATAARQANARSQGTTFTGTSGSGSTWRAQDRFQSAAYAEGVRLGQQAAATGRMPTDSEVLAAVARAAGSASAAESTPTANVVLRVEVRATTFRRPRADEAPAPARGRPGARPGARPAAGMMR